ncbi:unnamed protein product [Sphagnum jensenii]
MVLLSSTNCKPVVQPIESVTADQNKFLVKLEASSRRLFWPVAKPLEAIGESYVVPPQTAPVTVIGVDGSQIMPSHHEVHRCYLLNIGYTIIAYRHALKPVLATRPHLFHRPEDIYPLVERRRLQVDELFVSLERNILELEILTELAVASKQPAAPVVAFIDGSLIPWSVEKLTDRYKKRFLERMRLAMSVLQANQIPVVGYLSNSRATDVVNMLRVSVCPYDVSDCHKHCAALNEEDFPCSEIWPLADRQLFFKSLAPGRRSAIFLSESDVTRKWVDEQRICFAYAQVGSEIARVEFPKWMLDERRLLDLAFAVTLEQAKKGLGYPICLSEAHHLAVIRGAERSTFFELLAAHMVSLGMPKIRTSPKEERKKVGFV